MDTVSLSEDTIRTALKKGCDKAEVFIKTAKRLSVEAKDSAVEALESSRDFGMALKVIKKQGLGFAFTTSPDRTADIINDALQGADWTAPDEYVDIPDCRPASEVLVIDENIKNTKEDDIIKNALLLEKTALDFDTRIRKVRTAEIGLVTAKTTIVNSKGINISYESGYITASVSALASDGQDNQMGWDFAISRRLSDIDFISIARGASKKAIDLLGAKKISAVKVPVILDSSVASEFLDILSASLSAEAVQKKRSFLAGKAGKKIMSPLINIIDDGIMPWGTGTKPVDDEGVPTMKKTIVSGGMLQGFIHNTYTANKEGVMSTGNASRKSFKGLPGIDTTNLYIETRKGQGSGRSDSPLRLAPRLRDQGSKDRDLIKSISKGLLILEAMGVHTANPVSGDFSVGISGLWIEGGKIAYPVKEAIMSGNILELFKRIEGIGHDLRFYGKIGTPSLLIGQMDISA